MRKFLLLSMIWWSERSGSCWNMLISALWVMLYLSHLLHNSSIKLNWCHSKHRLISDANSVIKLRCRIQEHAIISHPIPSHVGTCMTLLTARKVWSESFMRHLWVNTKYGCWIWWKKPKKKNFLMYDKLICKISDLNNFQ